VCATWVGRLEPIKIQVAAKVVKKSSRANAKSKKCQKKVKSKSRRSAPAREVGQKRCREHVPKSGTSQKVLVKVPSAGTAKHHRETVT
jgi:hypothetical protein